ncbi:MAG: homoaconitase, partial [Ignavibacteriae bacterium]|nr:homoaconitase [Ignavibacteriota bacterium]
LVIEIPELVDDLKSKYGKEKLTVAIDSKAHLDYVSSQLLFDGKEYSFAPVGAAAQELVIAGGLESWIKNNL